jgi:hypothetical protein
VQPLLSQRIKPSPRFRCNGVPAYTRRVSEAIEVDLVKVLEPIANGQELLVRAGVNWNPGGRRAGDDTR